MDSGRFTSFLRAELNRTQTELKMKSSMDYELNERMNKLRKKEVLKLPCHHNYLNSRSRALYTQNTYAATKHCRSDWTKVH